MGKKKAPSHPGYVKMEDTPWITQGREIADVGGKGILENYNKVNVFSPETQKSLEARNNAIYKRAFDNMEKAYTDTMNKYSAANYGQFGTLNATPAAYRTDQYRKDFQRQMDDLAYNQAVNYDTLMDNELSRRYNTLDMFGNLYNYGQIPYRQDIRNWNIENTNRDIGYQNAMANYMNNRNSFGSNLNFGGAISGAMKGAATGSAAGPWGALAGGLLGGAGGLFGGKM